MSAALAYILGLITLPVIAAVGAVVIAIVRVFTLRTRGAGSCSVCDHMPAWDIGERSNAHWYAASWWHDIAWSYRRWHREAWATHWTNRLNHDKPIEDSPHYVSCDSVDCQFLNVKGPYSDEDAAAAVARQHTLARGTEHTTAVVTR